MAEGYEDRHRALRQPVTSRFQRPKGPGRPGTDTTWTQVDVGALMSFEARTGPLVDDLVAAAREHDHCAEMGACAICDALAELDEASARG